MSSNIFTTKYIKSIRNCYIQTFVQTICVQSTFYSNQYSFQEKHSTIPAETKFYCDILQSLEEGKDTLVMFWNLSRIFDTIRHSILLPKSKNYGIKRVSLDWVRSYLTGRCQYRSYYIAYIHNYLWNSTGIHSYTTVIYNLHKRLTNIHPPHHVDLICRPNHSLRLIRNSKQLHI